MLFKDAVMVCFLAVLLALTLAVWLSYMSVLVHIV